MYRTYLILILLLCFIGLISPQGIKAEVNVKDCLESDKDCLDGVEQEQDTGTDENDNLLGTDSDVTTGSVILNIFKIIFALGLVILLIYVFLTLLKKKNKLSEQSGALENLGGISVGQQKSIQIVRIGDKVYALGVGQDVTMLDEIEDETLIRQLQETEQTESQPMNLIKNVLTKKQKKQQSSEKEPHHFTDTLKLELDKLKQQRDRLTDIEEKEDDKDG